MHASIVFCQASEKVGMSDRNEICGRHGFGVLLLLHTPDNDYFGRIVVNSRK